MPSRQSKDIGKQAPSVWVAPDAIAILSWQGLCDLSQPVEPPGRYSPAMRPLPDRILLARLAPGTLYRPPGTRRWTHRALFYLRMSKKLLLRHRPSPPRKG